MGRYDENEYVGHIPTAKEARGYFILCLSVVLLILAGTALYGDRITSLPVSTVVTVVAGVAFIAMLKNAAYWLLGRTSAHSPPTDHITDSDSP